MDDLLIRRRMDLPITTGSTAQVQRPGTTAQGKQEGAGEGFRQVLERMSAGAEISFSTHAAGRIAQREIPMSPSGLERLSEGVQIARGRGIQDALILMDGSAFIVSAKNSTVITALNSSELKNKAITNIDGTVIL